MFFCQSDANLTTRLEIYLRHFEIVGWNSLSQDGETCISVDYL